MASWPPNGPKKSGIGCYRLPGGKQRRELAGFSIEEARAAEGKRRAQKIESPGILEKVPAERMTFDELADWYFEQRTIKKLASFNRIKGILSNFNEIFGSWIVSSIKLQDLEEYQDKRAEDGRTVKAFRCVKRKLRRGANARRRTLAIEEYLKLVDVGAPHLKGIITTAYNTGMRLGELLGLRWSHIDREHGVFRLPADLVKESKAKVIPMNHHVKRGRGEPEGVIFHDIRRTVKTNMLSAGVDKVYRDTILGHSLRGMDIHYMAPQRMICTAPWEDIPSGLMVNCFRQVLTKLLTKT